MIGIWLSQDQGVVIGEDRPENVVQMVVAPDWFKVPANTSDLSNIDMYAFGWIDEHPEVVEKYMPKGKSEIVHSDVQKLKGDGEELDLEETGKVIQKPSNPENKNTVRGV